MDSLCQYMDFDAKVLVAFYGVLLGLSIWGLAALVYSETDSTTQMKALVVIGGAYILGSLGILIPLLVFC